MPTETATAPVEDSIAKVGNEVAVGEDLEFQRRWWRFEKFTWSFFAFILLLDVLGVFGRGPLAKAQKQTPDGALRLNYERVERFGTPSMLTLHFTPNAVHGGSIQLWTSDSFIKELGAQRVIPQPLTSKTEDGGIVYTFPSGSHPDSVEFALQPAAIGSQTLTVKLVPDGDPAHAVDALSARVFVMP